MNYNTYKKALSQLSFGKRLKDSLYVYEKILPNSTPELASFVYGIKKNCNINSQYNVIKFATSRFRLSFLSYPHFIKEPHPVLKSSVTVNLTTGKSRKFDYSNTENPPILHRKETFLEPNHPLIPKFKALTKAEEVAGLYENTNIIGFKKNWEKLLKEKGLSYRGHKLIKKKQKKEKNEDSRVKIERHKTAIARYNFSKPVQTILEYNLIRDEATLFDYGCGQGDDVRALQNMGHNAVGWDPEFNPNASKDRADIVNLGFVLNIIEDQAERTEILHEAYALSKKLLVVSSMIATSSTAGQGRPYKDGILTKRGTFQKYFYQSELRQYIEDVLETTAVAVGPGIFIVFRDPVDQQEFLSKRNKRTVNWEELSNKLYPSRAARKKLKRDELYEDHKELLDNFWTQMLDLGRLPNVEEFDRYPEIKERIGSAKIAKQIFIDKFGEDTLTKAFEERRNDFLVYMALSNFKKKVPIKHLSKSLQADIKTFIGGYAKGLEESKKLLYSIGNSDIIESLCSSVGFGFFDHKAMYIHKSRVRDLHPILRIYIGCAGILYGEIQDADIIKIHKWSGKVTLLKYDDFEGNPLPELIERVKVNLRKQRIDIFDHQAGSQKQLLYFKANYVGQDHPCRDKWDKFSKKLNKLGFNKNDPIGPSKNEFIEIIEKKGLTKNLNPKRKLKSKQRK